ncbi:MAG TPA: hypothetical protein PK821_01805 [Victivallales bacterium]|nr:hypothetical protein [Victivallales bacterium]
MLRNKKVADIPKKGWGSSTRARFILIPLVIVLSLCVVLGFVASLISGKREALTPEQILEKNEWTREELVDAIGRIGMQNLQGKGGENRELNDHIKKQMDSFPESERNKITEQVVENFVKKGIEVWRGMKPGKRKKLLDEMRKEAELNRQAAEQMTGDEKAKARAAIMEERKAFEALNKCALNHLSPDERRDFAPLAKEWIRMMECLE